MINYCKVIVWQKRNKCKENITKREYIYWFRICCKYEIDVIDNFLIFVKINVPWGSVRELFVISLVKEWEWKRDKCIKYSILLLIDDIKEKFCEVRDGSKEKSINVFRSGFGEMEDGGPCFFFWHA